MMTFEYVPDNYDRWEQHQREQEEALACLPVCDICDNPIREEHFFEINDTKICEHCLNEYYRKETVDYVG